MNNVIRNAAPRAYLRGFKDVSGRPPVIEPELIPTHLPHVFLFTERGKTIPQLVSGDKMIRQYGNPTFDYRSKYANHQTVLVNTVNAEGNQMMVQRVLAPGVNPPSTMRLYVDVVRDAIPLYQRGPDNKFLLDVDDNKIPTGGSVEGYLLRWHFKPIMADGDDGRLLESGDPRLMESGEQRLMDIETDFGMAGASPGLMTSTLDGSSSLSYPIMDFEVADIGAYGNRIGIRFSAPTSESATPVDSETIEEQLAYLFRIAFVERDALTSTPKVLETLWGENSVDFSFKEGVYNDRTDKDLFIDDIVLPSYSQEKAAGLDEIRAPFGKVHVYHDNLEFVLEALQSTEVPADVVETLMGMSGPDKMHLINPFTAHDYDNIPYETVRVLGPSEDGVMLVQNAVYYAEGGFDGVMNDETFDAAVYHQLVNYGDLDAKTLDSAIYPQSVIYDTGFKMPTKKAMFVPMGRRPDMYVVVSTQDVTGPQNTPSDESSIAIALRTAARMYPESIIYGTPTCRAIIHGQSGHLLQSKYKKLLPLTIEFAQKCARYMGAGNGFWKNGKAFDDPPNNLVRMFKDVNADWVSPNVRSLDWDNGLTWVENFDRSSQYWPGIQTAYDDDSSVLNSAINMMAAVELNKVAERSFRRLTGISYLSPEQFIERSDKLIKELTAGRFDSRIIIVPETYYTANDEQRGYSWSCNIHMYAPNMKTVGSFTVVAHRIEDL